MGTIACVYIPAFPLQVELERRPTLRGTPVALVSEAERVLWASADAEKAGVQRDMPARQALALCRHLTVLAYDGAAYRTAWDDVLRALYAVSPVIESAAEGLAFLDVRGLPALTEGPAAMMEAIAAALPSRWQKLARIGMAVNKFVAHVAARRAEPGSPRWVRPGDTSTFLAFQPLKWVPASAEIHRRLHLLGLNLMGQLARLPREAVEAQFGKAGGRIWSLCRGEDDEPLRPHRWEQPVTERIAFPEPAVTRDVLIIACERLAAAVWKRPERRERPVRQVRLRARLSGEAGWERTLTLKQGVTTPRRLAFCLRQVVEGQPFSGAVEELALDVLAFAEGTGLQGSLFRAHRDTKERLAEAVRELKARYGYSPIHRLVEVEPWSRVPERRLALVEYEP